MAYAQPGSLITALDVGSWKVSALIAERVPGGDIQVLGTGQRESKGVKRGYVADVGLTEQAVREAVEQAERMAETNIEDVWVSFSAGSLASDIASVEVELGGHRIEQEDIDELLAAGRNTLDPDGRMILHAQPTLYTLDGLNGVKQPLGLHADTLGVDIHEVDHSFASRDGLFLPVGGRAGAWRCVGRNRGRHHQCLLVYRRNAGRPVFNTIWIARHH
jgi:cell division protein FtsA